MARPLSASSIYAISQGSKNDGADECHWCAGPCQRKIMHGERPPVQHTRIVTTAKRYGNAYMCQGCYLFKSRTRLTSFYLDGTFKDCQNPKLQSWFITEEKAWAIRPQDKQLLWQKLLVPPNRFALMLLTNPGGELENQLHTAIGNDNQELVSGTELGFTIDNVPHKYSVYELEDALTGGGAVGKEPGVAALIKLLGPIVPTKPLKIDTDEDEGKEEERKQGYDGMKKKKDLTNPRYPVKT